MCNWFWGVTDNFLPGHSRSQNFLKKEKGSFLTSTGRLSDLDFEGKIQIVKIVFKLEINFKIDFPTPLESRFGTPKFEFSVPENPQILIATQKFKFFFDQNLNFVLGSTRVRTAQFSPREYWQRQFPSSNRSRIRRERPSWYWKLPHQG